MKHTAPHGDLSSSQLLIALKSTLMLNYGSRFTTTYGSNILNGSTQMANPQCVMFTKRALPKHSKS